MEWVDAFQRHSLSGTWFSSCLCVPAPVPALRFRPTRYGRRHSDKPAEHWLHAGRWLRVHFMKTIIMRINVVPKSSMNDIVASIAELVLFARRNFAFSSLNRSDAYLAISIEIKINIWRCVETGAIAKIHLCSRFNCSIYSRLHHARKRLYREWLLLRRLLLLVGISRWQCVRETARAFVYVFGALCGVRVHVCCVDSVVHSYRYHFSGV